MTTSTPPVQHSPPPKPRFFDRHFAAILSTAVSLSAALITAGQVWQQKIGKDSELVIQRIRDSTQLQVQRLEQDRQWGLEIAKFVLDHQKQIYSHDTAEQREIRNLMLAAFGSSVGPVFSTLAFTDSAASTVWRSGRKLADSLATTLPPSGLTPGSSIQVTLVLPFAAKVLYRRWITRDRPDVPLGTFPQGERRLSMPYGSYMYFTAVDLADSTRILKTQENCEHDCTVRF